MTLFRSPIIVNIKKYAKGVNAICDKNSLHFILFSLVIIADCHKAVYEKPSFTESNRLCITYLLYSTIFYINHSVFLTLRTKHEHIYSQITMQINTT